MLTSLFQFKRETNGFSLYMVSKTLWILENSNSSCCECSCLHWLYSCSQFGISDVITFLTFSNIRCSFRSYLIHILYKELYIYKYVFYYTEKCFWSVTMWWADGRRIQFPVCCLRVVVHQGVGRNIAIEQFGSEWQTCADLWGESVPETQELMW